MNDDLGKKIVDRKGNTHNRDDWFSQQEAERLYKKQGTERERLKKENPQRHYKHPENVELGKSRIKLLVTVLISIVPYYFIFSLLLSFAADHLDALNFINGGNFFKNLGNYFMIYILGTCLYIFFINKFLKRKIS